MMWLCGGLVCIEKAKVHGDCLSGVLYMLAQGELVDSCGPAIILCMHAQVAAIVHDLGSLDQPIITHQPGPWTIESLLKEIERQVSEEAGGMILVKLMNVGGWHASAQLWGSMQAWALHDQGGGRGTSPKL